MLTGSLVAIMVLTVMLWGRYASSSETVPVVDRPFDPTMLTDAYHALKAEGLDAKISGDRVVVPADQQDHAFAVLSYACKLPADTPHAFEDVLKLTGPFDDSEKSKLYFNHAREMQLAQVISTFPGVTSAQVMINPTFERHIGSQPVMPSGTVVLRTRDDANTDHLVDSAAYTVIRTVAGMESKNVSVIINDTTHKVRDPNGNNGGLSDGDLYENIDKLEAKYQDRIAANIGYDKPLVTVSVDLNTENVTQTSVTYDPKKSAQLSKTEKSETDTSSQGSPASEPGVAPNTGMSVTTPSSQTNATNTEKTETDYENGLASVTETRSQPAGKYTVTAACVNLPRSAFLERYKTKHPGDTDPDEQALETWAKYDLDEVRQRVASACNMKPNDERIVVTIYADSQSNVALAGMGATATTSAGLSVTSHLKEIAIGVLALISLFMVSMIVRKGAPIGAGASLAGVGGGMSGPLGGFLEARSAALGDDDGTPVFGGGRPAMDGVELDEDSYKAQQMVEQVTSMVQENPDGAAALVKRWLNKA
jgi:flagellar biosynthesis/type III secretory pathway M-ring protein FliF/YscJ